MLIFQMLLKNLKEKDNQIQTLQEQYNELLSNIKEKDNRIIDLEFEMVAQNKDSRESLFNEKKDVGTEKPSCFWLNEIEEKDKEIERLECELRKRTCHLQEIVNNELWQKNKEIEKLQNRFTSINESKDDEIVKLRNELSVKDKQLKMLKEKISDLGFNAPANLDNLASSTSDDIKALQEQLKTALEQRKRLEREISDLKAKLNNVPEQDEMKLVNQLQRECTDLQEELEKSEKLRQESNEICTVLSGRLEELARFLESLLKQKSVLGFLGTKQTKLKQFLDETLDISRTLTVSIVLNPDQSLLQLSNVSTILSTSHKTNNFSITDILLKEDDDSIIPANVTLTYQSHLSRPDKNSGDNNVEQNEIIKVLREQIESLKKEIEWRDIELGKKLEKSAINEEILVIHSKSNVMKSSSPENKNKSALNILMKYHNENQSESESWSEPDRNVSLARIGLESVNSLNRYKQTNTSDSTEEEHINNSSSRSGSKRNNMLSEYRETINSLNKQITDLENKLKEKEAQLLSTEVAYYESDKLLKKEKRKVDEIKKHNEEYQHRIKEIEECLFVAESEKSRIESTVKEYRATIDKLENDKKALIENMEKKDKELVNRVNALEVERNKAEVEINVAKEKLIQVLKEKQEFEEALKNEYKNQIHSIEEKCENKIKAVMVKTEEQIKKLEDYASKLQSKYETEYIKRTEVEKLKNTITELELIKQDVKISEEKVQLLEENEAKLKLKLQTLERDHRDKVNNLRKELDNATLKSSEAVLEKTKLLNEKTELEKQIKEFASKESDFMKQVNEFQEDFANMKTSFQKRVANLERQKNKLELRIHELESLNFDLQNQLVKIQSGQVGDIKHSNSITNSSSRIIDMYLSRPSVANSALNYKRQNSDHSGYTSEDNANVERQNFNSSPDLGIESDQGRFSSLEAHVNVPRPFLQSLELTQCMNSILSDKNGQALCGEF